jgi:hypothetical protein
MRLDKFLLPFLLCASANATDLPYLVNETNVMEDLEFLSSDIKRRVRLSDELVAEKTDVGNFNLSGTADQVVSSMTVSLRGGRPILVLFSLEVFSSLARNFDLKIKVNGVAVSVNRTINVPAALAEGGFVFALIVTGVNPGSYFITGEVMPQSGGGSQVARDRVLGLIEL